MHDALRALAESPAFREARAPYALLDTDLRIRVVNAAYVAATQRDPVSMLDEILVEAFPDNPAVPSANAVRNLTASFTLVLDSMRPHTMPIQRYDVEPVRGSGRFVEKTWSPVNFPLFDERGRVAGIVHHVDDITDLARLVTDSGPAAAAVPGNGAGVPPTGPLRPFVADLRDRQSARLREALIALVSARAAVGNSPIAVRRRQLWRAVCDRAGDPDWRGWPHALCTTAVATLPGVAGAAIALHAGQVQQPLAASNAWTAQLEQLQYTAGEGPSITAFAEQIPVLVGAVGAEHGRWPGYADAAGATGVTGVWAFPLSAAVPLGTLTLYRRESRSIGAGEPADAGVLAELAEVVLLADQDRIAGELLDHRGPTDPYADVSVAVGIVTVQLGVAAADALSALRARAFATGRTITDLARDVVSGRIRLD